MLKDTIRGLDKVFQTDIPNGTIILVTGTPGTLKSGFVHNVLTNYLEAHDELGLYATLEEPKKSHLRNMKSLGIKKNNRLEIFDYSDIWKEYKGEEDGLDMTKITEDIIKFYKEKKGDKFTCFALDSLNALYSLADTKNLRKDSYHFFAMLRESNLTSFIMMETQRENNEQHIHEHFLVDGIIEVGILETKEDVTRYLQVKKMRATKHDMKKRQLIVGRGGLAVLGPAYEK